MGSGTGDCREVQWLYPDIELVVETYGGEYNDKILVETAGGVGPDVMLLDSISVPYWAEKGILIDRTPYLERKLLISSTSSSPM